MRPPANYDDGPNIGQEAESEPDPRAVSMMIYTKLAGRAVIRVVERCNEAQDNNHLDLSNCQLMQVPDAVYHLMRHTELKTCNLSANVITKIPPKFADNFSSITSLNLSHNQMAKLPDEIGNMLALQRLDVSHNAFTELPECIVRIQTLQTVNASNNHILDVNIEWLNRASPALQCIDLTNNPLTPLCHNQLSQISRLQIHLSEREKEDWEDLTI